MVGFYKLGSGKASVNWSQSVDEALCFGWIDGVRRSIDKESYCIRFTPRKAGSTWSSINIRKVEALRESGLMTAAGEAAFALRSKERSGIYAHESPAVELHPVFKKAFKKDKAAWDFYYAQAPSYKKSIAHWISNAKQEKTRLSRLEKLITASAAQKRLL